MVGKKLNYKDVVKFLDFSDDEKSFWPDKKYIQPSFVYIRTLNKLYLSATNDDRLKQDSLGLTDNYKWRLRYADEDSSFTIQSCFNDLVLRCDVKEDGGNIYLGEDNKSDKQKWFFV